MGVREQIIQVLRGAEVRRIRFSFAGSTGRTIAVDPSSFSRVAEAIEANQIHVVVGQVAGGSASYNSVTNTFNVGTEQHWSRAFDALVVHESVHASFDLTRITMPWLDNEFAAYIAQGYYLRNSGFSETRLQHVGTANQPYLGLRIVESIVRDGSVDSFWLDQLHGSLASSPQYHSYINGTFTGNG